MVNPYRPSKQSALGSSDKQLFQFLGVSFAAAVIATLGGYGLVSIRAEMNIDTTTQARRELILQTDNVTLGCWAGYFLIVMCGVFVVQALLCSARKWKVVHPAELFVSIGVIAGTFTAEGAVATMRALFG